MGSKALCDGMAVWGTGGKARAFLLMPAEGVGPIEGGKVCIEQRRDRKRQDCFLQDHPNKGLFRLAAMILLAQIWVAPLGRLGLNME